MSRKDFEAIAASLRKYQKTADLFGDPDFKDLVNDLALTFEDLNPRFDRFKFNAAIYD